MIDIVDIIQLSRHVFISQDLFIDIKVYEDGSHEVLDMDEFAGAIELDVIDKKQILKALTSFQSVFTELNQSRNGFLL